MNKTQGGKSGSNKIQAAHGVLWVVQIVASAIIAFIINDLLGRFKDQAPYIPPYVSVATLVAGVGLIGVVLLLTFCFKQAGITKKVLLSLSTLGFLCVAAGSVFTINANWNAIYHGIFTGETINARQGILLAEIPVRENYDGLELRIGGDFKSNLLLELEKKTRYLPDKLDISDMQKNKDIYPGSFYFVEQGTFAVNTTFTRNDWLLINVVNTSSFEGKIIIELIGSKTRSKP
jgi:hypothetical protein